MKTSLTVRDVAAILGWPPWRARYLLTRLGIARQNGGRRGAVYRVSLADLAAVFPEVTRSAAEGSRVMTASDIARTSGWRTRRVTRLLRRTGAGARRGGRHMTTTCRLAALFPGAIPEGED